MLVGFGSFGAAAAPVNSLQVVTSKTSYPTRGTVTQGPTTTTTSSAPAVMGPVPTKTASEYTSRTIVKVPDDAMAPKPIQPAPVVDDSAVAKPIVPASSASPPTEVAPTKTFAPVDTIDDRPAVDEVFVDEIVTGGTSQDDGIGTAGAVALGLFGLGALYLLFREKR